MTINQNCSDTIVGQLPTGTTDLNWRRWLGEGLALLAADARDLFGVLVRWQKRSQSRFELASLDERTLKDLGISRGDRDWEVAKPFWRE